MPSEDILQIVSLFSGAGGLDFATELAGRISTLARLELQPEYCDTIRRSEESGLLSKAPLFAEDIRTVAVEDVLAERRAGLPLGVIGGPPCETFSSMGRKRGLSDPRGMLVMSFADFVDKSDADFFVLENVPALARMSDGAILKELLERFEEQGFAVAFNVLRASDFGAATSRRRLFIVGIRGGPSFEFPAATHAEEPGRSLKPWVSVGLALAGLPSPSDAGPGVPTGHVRIHHRPAVIERFATVPSGGYDYVRKRSRLALDRPSVSLVAGDLNGTRSHIHPIEDRELTNRECARIQGFPDNYEFAGSRMAVAKQIANAVPVPLGTAIMMALLDRVW